MATPVPIVTGVQKQKRPPQYRDTLFLTAQELKALRVADARLANQVRLTHVKFKSWSSLKDHFVSLSSCTFRCFTAEHKKKFRGTRVWRKGKLIAIVNLPIVHQCMTLQQHALIISMRELRE